MKHLRTILITSLCISLYGSETIDPKEWTLFQEKYPIISSIVKHNEDVVQELARDVQYKKIRATKLDRQAPNEIQAKIKRNAAMAQATSALIPAIALAGVGIRNKIYNDNQEKSFTKKFFITQGLRITLNLINNKLLPKYILKYTSAELSKCGLMLHMNITNVLQSYVKYIIKDNQEDLWPFSKQFAAFLAGTFVSKIHKTENNHSLRLPATEWIILTDKQAVDIVTRSAGQLIKKGTVPKKSNAMLEVLKNTTSELGYNILAQLLHKAAEHFQVEEYLDWFISKDCNPQGHYQLETKKIIQFLICLAITSGGEFDFDLNIPKDALTGLDNIL